MVAVGWQVIAAVCRTRIDALHQRLRRCWRSKDYVHYVPRDFGGRASGEFPGSFGCLRPAPRTGGQKDWAAGPMADRARKVPCGLRLTQGWRPLHEKMHQVPDA
jgi:hypothetical protein